MRLNPSLLLAIGILLLAIGAYMSFSSGPLKDDPAMIAQCRERVKDQGAEMLGRCDGAAFATAMTTTDADQAAAAISASNNEEISGNMIGMFLLGFGAVCTLASLLGWRKQARQPRA